MATIGIHLDHQAPVDEAAARGADCVQFFVSDPQDWKIPPPGPRAAEIAATPMTKYVHAPYTINLASGNNRIRIPSRKILADTCRAAEAFGAVAVIVHGGHVTADDDPEQGFLRWRKALEQHSSPLPLLLENTAGGNYAMARRLDMLAGLWEQVGELGLGFCLDTCHAHAGGEGLEGIVERVKAITGRVDLVHANDSKDAAGSGRDRHENLGRGRIGLEAIAAVVAAAGVPAICETPGGVAEHRADVEALRGRLSG
ncbi:MAG TPA: deoxyribonuclease IV [Actinomycetes bacterium]|jgi:deoxyribonuclease-4|nr:deoxyribonuclease IV [Actinomycetes bacterium]